MEAHKRPGSKARWTLERRVVAAFSVATLTIILMGWASEKSIFSLIEDSNATQDANEYLAILESVFSEIREAESAQRGLVLTEGGPEHLRVFENAAASLAEDLGNLRTNDFTLTSQASQDLALFVAAVESKMEFVRETIAISKRSIPEARERIRTGEGFTRMENVRAAYGRIRRAIEQAVKEGTKRTETRALRTVSATMLGVLLDISILIVVFIFIRRELKRRRAIEAELSAARDMAVEATRLKSEFLASMSHEIRTPMNGVIGMTGLLLDSGLNKDQRRLAETSLLSANSLLTIINDILDYSKIEAGKMNFEEMDFELQPVLESALDLFIHPVNEKGLELVCLVEPDAPKRLRGDAGRLRQIVVNLIGNAVKFTERGEVVLKAESAGPNQLKISVRDTGIGIAPEALPRLFAAFVQADGSTTRQFGGTGLGLAICRKLVEGMGGKIGADSALGKGSTFWFTVRMTELPAMAAEIAVPGELAGRKVLAVDDHPTNRLILERQLQNWGLQPLLASSGDEALALLKKHGDIAAAVLDLHMPEISGLDLARMIKSDPSFSSVALVLLSSGGADTTRAAREAGFSAWLTKPVKQSDLYDALSSAFKSQTPDGGDASAAPEVSVSKLKILLAEDNRVNQMVALGFLERLGYRGDVVADGVEALEAIKRISYDLIFMDCQMPNMDGFETTRRIRELERQTGGNVRIIAMTANAMEGDRERCLASGMDDYLSKPLSKARIKAVLDPIAEKCRSRDLFALDPDALHELRALRGAAGAPLLNDLIQVFFQDGPVNMEKLRAAMAEGNLELVTERAHAMRGGARLFGAIEFSRILEEIENHARAGNRAPLADLFTQVERAFSETNARLKKELQ